VRQDLHGASHMKTPADIPLERIAMGAAPGYEPHRDGHWPALRLALRRVKENGGHTEWPVRARASTAPARTSPEGPSSCPTWRPPPHPPHAAGSGALAAQRQALGRAGARLLDRLVRARVGRRALVRGAHQRAHVACRAQRTQSAPPPWRAQTRPWVAPSACTSRRGTR